MVSMSPVEWAATLSGFVAVSIAFLTGVRWIVKSYLIELKPNGGSSIKDTVNEIKDDIVEMRISVAKLEARFSDHLDACKHETR
jgi:hypothetical protein